RAGDRYVSFGRSWSALIGALRPTPGAAPAAARLASRARPLVERARPTCVDGGEHAGRPFCEVQRGEVFAGDPAELAHLFAVGAWDAVGDATLEERHHVRRAVAAGVLDDEVVAAEDTEDADRLDLDADLLAELADDGFGGSFARLD